MKPVKQTRSESRNTIRKVGKIKNTVVWTYVTCRWQKYSA
jgi:hypothetical protein